MALRGEDLRNLMSKHGVTRSVMGKYLGVTGDTVGKWISEYRSIPVAAEHMILYLFDEIPSSVVLNGTFFKVINKEILFNPENKRMFKVRWVVPWEDGAIEEYLGKVYDI